MSLPKQWVSEWLGLQEHLAHDGGKAEDYQFIMTHSVQNVTLLDKDYVIVSLSLGLIPDPS